MRRGGEALKDGYHPSINRKEAVRLRENNNSVMCICMRIINRIDLGVYDSVERRSFVICLLTFRADNDRDEVAARTPQRGSVRGRVRCW
jgi:hypothetical protein